MNHHQQIRSTTAAEQQEASAGGGGGEEYEDLMPVMAGRLGAEGLLSELRAGFRLLADPARAPSPRRACGGARRACWAWAAAAAR